MFSHAQIWEFIDAVAKESNCSTSALAIRAGLDATSLNPSKRFTKHGRARWPSTETIFKVIQVSSINRDFLLKFLINQKVDG